MSRYFVNSLTAAIYVGPQAVAARLAAVRHKQPPASGRRMESLRFPVRQEAELETRTLDVVKTSEIEGESLNAEQVRSSIARRLGMEVAGTVSTDRNVEGVVDMIFDATKNFSKPLTPERLYGWHAAMFPTGHSGMHKITVGAWRRDERGSMQVISGAMGRQTVHYEAPPGDRLDAEMAAFLEWVNQVAPWTRC
jgi:Fic family protein